MEMVMRTTKEEGTVVMNVDNLPISTWDLKGLYDLADALEDEESAAIIAQNGNFPTESPFNPFSQLLNRSSEELEKIRAYIKIRLRHGEKWSDARHLNRAKARVRTLKKIVRCLIRNKEGRSTRRRVPATV